MKRFNLTCLRCGKTWIRRTENEPKQCPDCKSPYWNRPRVRKQPTEPKEVTK